MGLLFFLILHTSQTLTLRRRGLRCTSIENACVHALSYARRCVRECTRSHDYVYALFHVHSILPIFNNSALMPITTLSFQTLRTLEKLVHDMMRDLENVMKDADYLGEHHQKNFNTAGKLRNITRNTLDRIVNVRKDIQQLEFVDNLTFDNFIAKKKRFMNECSSIEQAVEVQWAEVQSFISTTIKQYVGTTDADAEASKELEMAYDEMIAGQEININLEKS